MCWELIDGEVGLQLKEDLAIMKSQNALNPRCREIIQFAREREILAARLEKIFMVFWSEIGRVEGIL